MSVARRIMGVVMVTVFVSPMVFGLKPVAAEPQTSPDLYQETVQAPQRQTSTDHHAAYMFGAVAMSAFAAPGRAMLCVAGSAVAIGLLAATFGTGYKAAKYFAEEGCGGSWVITPDDLRRANAELAQRSLSGDY